MVGPISSEERESTMRKLKAVFVLIIGLSGGLITLQADVSLLVSAIAILVSLLVGTVVVWFVFPGTGEIEPANRRRPPRR